MRCGASKLAWLPETFCEAAASPSTPYSAYTMTMHGVIIAINSSSNGTE